MDVCACVCLHVHVCACLCNKSDAEILHSFSTLCSVKVQLADSKWNGDTKTLMKSPNKNFLLSHLSCFFLGVGLVEHC